jgi:hypothetical protein
MNRNNTYVDFRMKEWGIVEQSRRIQNSVRRVLSELVAEALMVLKDPRLEVIVLPESDWGMGSVWAYFPVHRRRSVAKALQPKPGTRVLLVLDAAGFERTPVKLAQDILRDHLGHTLLYLCSPKARNECPDAQREWRRWRFEPPTMPSTKKVRSKGKGGAKESGRPKGGGGGAGG